MLRSAHRTPTDGTCTFAASIRSRAAKHKAPLIKVWVEDGIDRKHHHAAPTNRTAFFAQHLQIGVELVSMDGPSINAGAWWLAKLLTVMHTANEKTHVKSVAAMGERVLQDLPTNDDRVSCSLRGMHIGIMSGMTMEIPVFEAYLRRNGISPMRRAASPENQRIYNVVETTTRATSELPDADPCWRKVLTATSALARRCDIREELLERDAAGNNALAVFVVANARRADVWNPRTDVHAAFKFMLQQVAPSGFAQAHEVTGFVRLSTAMLSAAIGCAEAEGADEALRQTMVSLGLPAAGGVRAMFGEASDVYRLGKEAVQSGRLVGSGLHILLSLLEADVADSNLADAISAIDHMTRKVCMVLMVTQGESLAAGGNATLTFADARLARLVSSHGDGLTRDAATTFCARFGRACLHASARAAATAAMLNGHALGQEALHVLRGHALLHTSLGRAGEGAHLAFAAETADVVGASRPARMTLHIQHAHAQHTWPDLLRRAQPWITTFVLCVAGAKVRGANAKAPQLAPVEISWRILTFLRMTDSLVFKSTFISWRTAYDHHRDVSELEHSVH